MPFDLAIVLTAAGATAAAGLIATLIELAKTLPAIGPWIDAKREPGVAVLLSAVLVSYAYLVTTVPDPVSAFGAFLAFVGIAALASKAHDTVLTRLPGSPTSPPPASTPTDPIPVEPSTPAAAGLVTGGLVAPAVDVELQAGEQLVPTRATAARVVAGEHGRNARRRRRVAGAE